MDLKLYGFASLVWFLFNTISGYMFTTYISRRRFRDGIFKKNKMISILLITKLILSLWTNELRLSQIACNRFDRKNWSGHCRDLNEFNYPTKAHFLANINIIHWLWMSARYTFTGRSSGGSVATLATECLLNTSKMPGFWLLFTVAGIPSNSNALETMGNAPDSALWNIIALNWNNFIILKWSKTIWLAKRVKVCENDK